MHRKCFICKKTQNLETHHVFRGSSRKQADKHGMTVDLCDRHHRGPGGVHSDKAFDLYLKRKYQEQFEQTHTREEFIRLFGRNYL